MRTRVGRRGRAALLLTAVLVLAGCCPAPQARARPTSFAAVVEGTEPGLARVRLVDDRVAVVEGEDVAGLEAGDRIYVEGYLSEGRVTATRITSVGGG